MRTTTLGPTRRQPVGASASSTAPLPRLSANQLVQAIALGGSVAAAVLLTYTVLALPNRLLLSEYVHVPGGLEPFVGGLLALAVAIFAAARLTVVRDAAAGAVLRVAGSGAVVAAAFPTDAHHLAAPSLSSLIHRYAALVVFVALPVAAWLLLREASGDAAGPARAARVLRVVAGVSAVAVLGTLLLHPSSPLAGLTGHPGWVGGFQRLMAASDVALVATMAVVARPRDHQRDHIAW